MLTFYFFGFMPKVHIFLAVLRCSGAHFKKEMLRRVEGGFLLGTENSGVKNNFWIGSHLNSKISSWCFSSHSASIQRRTVSLVTFSRCAICIHLSRIKPGGKDRPVEPVYCSPFSKVNTNAATVFLLLRWTRLWGPARARVLDGSHQGGGFLTEGHAEIY